MLKRGWCGARKLVRALHEVKVRRHECEALANVANFYQCAEERGAVVGAPISLSLACARRDSSAPGKRRITSRRSFVPVAFMPNSSSAKPFFSRAAASL